VGYVLLELDVFNPENNRIIEDWDVHPVIVLQRHLMHWKELLGIKTLFAVGA
jgi:hypothetical protein